MRLKEENLAVKRRLMAAVAAGAAIAASAALAGTASAQSRSGGEGWAHAGAVPGASTRGSVSTLATPPPGYSVTGIDVSNHQGTIDWAGVAGAGHKFAYAKSVEGTYYVDPYFTANSQGAKANGLYFGAYTFANPADSGGVAQADFLMDHALYANDDKTLPLMLDIEWPYVMSNGQYLAPFPCYGLSPTAMVDWIRAFVTEVRARTGRVTMIYTAASWWNQCTANDTSFNDNPLFIADYSGSVTTLPAGWTTWTLWQYTGSSSVPGISGNVDGDVFNGDASQLAELAKAPAGLPDVTGDGYADLIGRTSDGGLWLYQNGRDPTAPYAAGRQVGWGWGGFDRIMLADVSGDGFADIAATKPDGSLWLYRGGHGYYPFGSAEQIGAGFNIFTRLVAADTTGDGLAELVGMKADGGLWLYRNAGGSRPYGSGTQIGWGWTTFSRVLLADLTGDGLADALGMLPDGTYWLYQNGGNPTAPFSSGRQVGSGGTDYSRLLLADVDGDGRGDLVGMKPDGSLWLRRNGNGSPELFNAAALIGTGWGMFNLVF